MNKFTAKECMQDSTFNISVENKCSLHVDDIISKIKKNRKDLYSLLNGYARYLGENKISTLH